MLPTLYVQFDYATPAERALRQAELEKLFEPVPARRITTDANRRLRNLDGLLDLVVPQPFYEGRSIAVVANFANDVQMAQFGDRLRAYTAASKGEWYWTASQQENMTVVTSPRTRRL